MMLAPAVLLAHSLAGRPDSPVALQQTSTGFCSPNIVNNRGTIIFHCSGVDPAALELLNRELAGKERDLRTTREKLAAANLWAARYLELKTRLANSDHDSALAHEAATFLQQGQLDRSIATLDKLLKGALSGSGVQITAGQPPTDPAARRRFAATEYNLGLALELKFQPSEALPHFERAFHADPSFWAYGLAYANALFDRNDYVQAEPVLIASRKVAQADSDLQPRELPITLNGLALLYSHTGRAADARIEYEEALKVTRTVAPNPPSEAEILNNLGVLYKDAKQADKAEKNFHDALTLFTSLAERRRGVYDAYILGTLTNLATLYGDTRRMTDAATYYGKALDLCRTMQAADPAAYTPDLARTLNNRANFYRSAGRLEEAEADFKAAEQLFNQLAGSDPATYKPYLASLSGNLLNLYTDESRFAEAEKAGTTSLRLARELESDNPAAYHLLVATTLTRLGVLYSHTGRRPEAEQTFRDALDLLGPLAETNRSYELDLAHTLNSQANFYLLGKQYDQAEHAYKQAAALYDRHTDLSLEEQFFRASGLLNLAELYGTLGRPADAEAPIRQALSVYRELAKDAPSVYQPFVGRALCDLALAHYETGRPAEPENADALQLLKIGHPGDRCWTIPH